MMQRKHWLWGLALLLLCISVPVGARILYAGNGVFLTGSNTVAGIVRHLAEAGMADNPDTAISVSGGGTTRGLKALRDGVAHIAMLSAEPDAEDMGNMPLRMYALSLDAVVPVTHPANAVPSLSVKQLRRIFSGKITNWQEVGGRDLPIVVLSHDGLSGTYEVWKQKVLGADSVVTPRARILETGPTLRAVAEDVAAIGYVPFARLPNNAGVRPQAHDAGVRPLAVEGVSATPATIKDGSFPLCRPLLLATVQNPNEATRKVLDFFLDPQRGGKVQLTHGFIPAPPSRGE